MRRRPRGAPHGAPRRLRRGGDQPLPRLRVDRGPDRRGPPRPRLRRAAQDGAQLHQGLRQGRAQGDVEDGRVDGGQLHRRPDLRGARPRRRARRALLHRHGQQARRDRPRRDRGRGRRPARHRPPDPSRGARPSQARARRRVPVAARGGAPSVQSGDRVQAPARHPGQALRHLSRLLTGGRRPVEAAGHAARAVRPEDRSAAARAARGGRAGGGDRAAVLDRGDELRLDLRRGPRDPGDRDEPPRWEEQHRRGRRGSRTAARPWPPLGRQAGRIGPVRRDRRVPHQRRRPADQDGPGGQAGRGRPAPRPQGLPVDRQDEVLHAGRRPDQPATAPRHLLDRGPQAAHPRPEELQPGGARARQARRRGRRGHRRRRREQGQGRRRPDLRPRRRHRRQPADVAEARRRAVGAGPRRDPADPAPQRAARPHRRADRRSAQDRARRRDRGAARRRGVRVRHRPVGRLGLRDDAGLPPRHVPGRDRDPEPGTAQAVHRASPSSSRRSSSTSPRRCAS